jgi:hypothetical protein
MPAGLTGAFQRAASDWLRQPSAPKFSRKSRYIEQHTEIVDILIDFLLKARFDRQGCDLRVETGRRSGIAPH